LKISRNNERASSSASNYAEVIQRCICIKMLSNGKQTGEIGRLPKFKS
jgi:hypothetical protein